MTDFVERALPVVCIENLKKVRFGDGLASRHQLSSNKQSVSGIDSSET